MQKGIHIQYVNDNEEDGEFPKPIERFEELAFPNWLWDELFSVLPLSVSQQVGTSQVLEQYLEASAKTTMDSLHAKLERFACEARARQIILPESVEPARYYQASLIFSCVQACFK